MNSCQLKSVDHVHTSAVTACLTAEEVGRIDGCAGARGFAASRRRDRDRSRRQRETRNRETRETPPGAQGRCNLNPGLFSFPSFGTLIVLTYDDYYLLTNPLDFLTNLANQISLTQLDSLKLGLDQPTSWGPRTATPAHASATRFVPPLVDVPHHNIPTQINDSVQEK